MAGIVAVVGTAVTCDAAAGVAGAAGWGRVADFTALVLLFMAPPPDKIAISAALSGCAAVAPESAPWPSWPVSFANTPLPPLLSSRPWCS
jgi:hypothetical protein